MVFVQTDTASFGKIEVLFIEKKLIFKPSSFRIRPHAQRTMLTFHVQSAEPERSR